MNKHLDITFAFEYYRYSDPKPYSFRIYYTNPSTTAMVIYVDGLVYRYSYDRREYYKPLWIVTKTIPSFLQATHKTLNE